MESELAHGEVVIGLGSTGQGAARAVLHRATQGRIRHCALVRRRAWRLLGQATSDVVALGLPVEATISDGILQDVAPVNLCCHGCGLGLKTRDGWSMQTIRRG
jgi:hypothetical protein